jgi:hypothetical protein
MTSRSAAPTRRPGSGDYNAQRLAGHYTLRVIPSRNNRPCFIGRDADGALIENKTTWPKGLQAFGAELRSHGMKLGIYTCVGPKTCGGCVASEGHEDQDMQTFADWGAEYVKVDSCSRNCTAAAGVPNATTCGETLWSRFTSAIKKTGKDMVYSIVCNCDPARGDQPWKWAAPVANSWYGARLRQKFTLEGAIGSHACSLEASMRVTNGIPLGCSLHLPIGIVNCVQTLKANQH